jgi:hypothetical protein
MSIKQRLKNYPSLYTLLLQVLNTVNYFSLRFKILFPKYKLSETWSKRTASVSQCEDNKKITHVPDAGKIMDNHQVMHNGLKITLGSYYDYGMTVLIRENKGVHEPEEEYAFQEILKYMPAEACMLELGSFWAFYSMWFASNVAKANCIMIEPDPHKINFGKLNFKMNSLRGTFDLGFISDKTILNKNIPDYTVDHLIEKYNLPYVHMLHSDIQGHEMSMLRGAAKAFRENKIGYVFISTHSNELHYQCKDFLTEAGFKIVRSLDLNQTSSWDGLLIGKSNSIQGVDSL